MSKSDNLMGVKFVSTEFHFITAGLKLILGGEKKRVPMNVVILL